MKHNGQSTQFGEMNEQKAHRQRCCICMRVFAWKYAAKNHYITNHTFSPFRIVNYSSNSKREPIILLKESLRKLEP